MIHGKQLYGCVYRELAAVFVVARVPQRGQNFVHRHSMLRGDAQVDGAGRSELFPIRVWDLPKTEIHNKVEMAILRTLFLERLTQ